MFDAQCDLAAIVYGASDDPDGVLIDFADDLRRSGRRPVGLIQLGRSCRLGRAPLGAVMLPEGESIRMVSADDTAVVGCGLDPGRLADFAGRIAGAIENGADLVIINRFGRQEAEGRGLIDLISHAVEADIPLLTAVPDRYFTAWVHFTAGMHVRLNCRREALDRWWGSITGIPAWRNVRTATFCEAAK